MTRLYSYIFIFIFTANALAIAMMSIWYTTDKQYFIDNFCVNKEKVALECNGRCHLKNQISGKIDNNQKEQISIPVLEFEFLETINYTNITLGITEIISIDFLPHLFNYKSFDPTIDSPPPIG